MAIEYTVRHAIPGRLRLYVPVILRGGNAGELLQNQLESVDGVQAVRVNVNCGSVTVEYDQRVRNVAAQICRSVARLVVPPESKTAIQVRGGNGRSVVPQPRRTRKLAGNSLLVLGVVGWLLPLVPGTPFFIAGVALLGKNDPAVKRGLAMLGQLRKTLPSLVPDRTETGVVIKLTELMIKFASDAASSARLLVPGSQ